MEIVKNFGYNFDWRKQKLEYEGTNQVHKVIKSYSLFFYHTKKTCLPLTFFFHLFQFVFIFNREKKNHFC